MTWRQLIALAVIGITAFVLFAFVIFPNVYAEPTHDPRIAQTVAAQSLRFPAPDGCFTAGGWEDGSIVAYCYQPAWEQVDADTYFAPLTGDWIAHGPDSDDLWALYEGPILPVWGERVDAFLCTPRA